MKYAIDGFSQSKLLEYKLDIVDALILRWFADWASSRGMKQIILNGRIYCWIHYPTIIKEFPVMGITNTKSIAQRFDKYVAGGIMSKEMIKTRKGTDVYFSIVGPVFRSLLYEENDERWDKYNCAELGFDFSSDSNNNPDTGDSSGDDNQHKNLDSGAENDFHFDEKTERTDENNGEPIELPAESDEQIAEFDSDPETSDDENQHRKLDSGAKKESENTQEKPHERSEKSIDLSEKQTKTDEKSRKNDIERQENDGENQHKKLTSGAHKNLDSGGHKKLTSGALNDPLTTNDPFTKNTTTTTSEQLVDVYKNAVKKHLELASLSQDFWETLTSLVIQNRMTSEQVAHYLDYCIDYARSKKPRSVSNYVYQTAVKQYMVYEFWAWFSTQKPKSAESKLNVHACAVCGKEFTGSKCPECNFAVSDSYDEEGVTRARKIRQLPKTQREEMKKALENSWNSDLSFFERMKAVNAIYQKYGVQ